MCLAVCFGDGGSHGQSARVVVLDHGDGDLGGEIPYRAPRGIGVHIVVIAHGFAAKLLGVGEPADIERIYIQGGILMGVLTVSQNMRAVPGAGVLGWELAKLHLLGRILGTRVSDGVNGLVDARRFRPMGTGPLVDRGIVGSCVGKGLRRQPTAFLQGESLAVLDGAWPPRHSPSDR